MVKLKLIRGSRILKQLDESTYVELKRNVDSSMPPTDKRQHALSDVTVTSLELIPAIESKTLIVKATVTGNTDKYHQTIQFENVVYHEEESPTTVTFEDSSGNEYYIDTISLASTNVKVSCSCLDFQWRFSMWNYQHDSLVGDPPPNYIKKTNRPPVNPRKVPGVCKHIIKCVEALRSSKVVK